MDILAELERHAKQVMPNYPNDVCSRAKAEIERLRAALYDAREYVEHQLKRTGEVWAQDRLDKIDAALGRRDLEQT